MNCFKEDIKKIPRLILGFWFLALGLALTKKAGLGLNAWGVFHQGLSVITNISFGKIVQIVGIIVLFLSIFIKIFPGIGTLLNILLIGTFIDFIDSFLYFDVSNIYFRFTLLFIGLILNTLGTALYILCELGKGPRDGLFMGLTKTTGISVKYIRPAIESVVLIIGYLLGGLISVGTVIITLTSGYLVNYFFALHNYDAKYAKQRKLKDWFIQN